MSIAPGPWSGQLRLFAPVESDSDDGIHAELTLRLFFERAVWPYLSQERNCGARTRQTYLEALKWWEALTRNPTIALCEKTDLIAFREGLSQVEGRKREKLSAFTAKKHCGAINTILAHAGPPDRLHPDALELVPRLPHTRLPKLPRKRPHGVTTFDELERLLVAAKRRTWWDRRHPRTKHELPRYSAAAFWLAILLTAYVTGFRRGTLLSLRIRDYQNGFLVATSAAGVETKGDVDDEKWLPAVVQAALVPLIDGRPLDAPIFGWPYHLRTLGTHYERIQKDAGLPSDRRKWIKFHGLRKRHATEAIRINPVAAQMSLNHTTAATMLQHYGSPAEIVQALIEQLPLPAMQMELPGG